MKKPKNIEKIKKRHEKQDFLIFRQSIDSPPPKLSMGLSMTVDDCRWAAQTAYGIVDGCR